MWANLYFPYMWHHDSPRKALQVAMRAAGFSWGQDERVYFSIWEALDEVRQKWDRRGGENTNIGQNRIDTPVFAREEATEYLFSSPSVSQPLADSSGYATGLQSISNGVGIQGRAKGGWKRPRNGTCVRLICFSTLLTALVLARTQTLLRYGFSIHAGSPGTSSDKAHHLSSRERPEYDNDMVRSNEPL